MKCANQTVDAHDGLRIIVVCMQEKQVFWRRGPFSYLQESVGIGQEIDWQQDPL